MSSFPGTKLEDAVDDAFGYLSEERLKKVVEFYEPYREQIEERLEWYSDKYEGEEDEPSWRDNQFIVFEDIPDPPKELWVVKQGDNLDS